MGIALGESDYRRGALERLRESDLLIRQKRFSGGVYLAGRAVEAMLRAVIWKRDQDMRMGRKSLDTGHDLRDLLSRVRNLGVLRGYEHADELADNVQRVARLWFNNMRFVPTNRIKTYWWSLGEISGRRTLKQAVEKYYDACSAIVKRCEVLCQS